MNDALSSIEQEMFRKKIENSIISQMDKPQVYLELVTCLILWCSFEISDILPTICGGVEAIVQDDFSKCFQSSVREPWNWNAYLFILYHLGVLIRYFFLFPIRFFGALV
jgi:hypothetical protein